MEDSDINFAFDSIVLSEEKSVERGFAEGYREGQTRGRREEDIMQEIRTHGPLQATMDVHQAGNLQLTAL